MGTPGQELSLRLRAEHLCYAQTLEEAKYPRYIHSPAPSELIRAFTYLGCPQRRPTATSTCQLQQHFLWPTHWSCSQDR